MAEIIQFKPKFNSTEEKDSELDDDKIEYLADMIENPDEEYLDFLLECYQQEYQKIDQLAYDNFKSKDYVRAYIRFEVNLEYCKNDIERYHTTIMMGLSARLYSKKWYSKKRIKKWLVLAEEAFLKALALCDDKELTISALFELGINHLDRFKSSNNNRYLEDAETTLKNCHRLMSQSKNFDIKRMAICEYLMGETMFLLDEDNKDEAVKLMKSAHKKLKGQDDKYEFDNLSRLGQISNLYRFIYSPRRMMLYIRQNLST